MSTDYDDIKSFLAMADAAGLSRAANRLTAPIAFGTAHLAPLLTDLMDTTPSCDSTSP